jgi:hypothetical protein
MSENKLDDVLEIGRWLGRREAFSLAAGRCSAADAKCLRELRESKKYKGLGLTWEQCSKQKVGICRSVADQIIRTLEEFGPDYFVVAQVTGILAAEYRRIRSAVSDHKLLCAGEEIPIEVENAARLAAAIEALRHEAANAPEAVPDPDVELARNFARAERATRAALALLNKLCLMPLALDGRMRLQSMIGETASKLESLEMQFKF